MFTGGMNIIVCVLLSEFRCSKVFLTTEETLLREVDRHSWSAAAEKWPLQRTTARQNPITPCWKIFNYVKGKKLVSKSSLLLLHLRSSRSSTWAWDNEGNALCTPSTLKGLKGSSYPSIQSLTSRHTYACRQSIVRTDFFFRGKAPPERPGVRTAVANDPLP
ncbi:hypothetical protein HAX54_049923 [Datura stramonium]|uniref:Secreted protein n=1 Tax=Datura stramonium TaxID=4076 RepID=A0ABS8RQZ9_DATST|nr:hypothetical protein [Datura stramonium]